MQYGVCMYICKMFSYWAPAPGNEANVLLQVGSVPLQFPVWVQVRVSSPSRTKPGLQLYTAVPPSTVLLDDTNPFLG